MGTPRWQLREMEQRRFLEKLLREGDLEAGEDYYEFYRQLAVAILTILPECMEKVRVGNPFPPQLPLGHSYLQKYNGEFLLGVWNKLQSFIRVPEEGPYLLWRLSESALERASHLFTGDYQSASFTKEQALYGGKRIGDAPEEEVQAALRD